MDRDEEKIIPERFKSSEELTDGESFDRENALQTLIQQIDKHTDEAEKLLSDEDDQKEEVPQERRKRNSRNKKRGTGKKASESQQARRSAGGGFLLYGIITVMAINIAGLGYLFYLNNAKLANLEATVEEISQLVSQNEKAIASLKQSPSIAPSIPMTELVGRVGTSFESSKNAKERQKKQPRTEKKIPPSPSGPEKMAVTHQKKFSAAPAIAKSEGEWRIVLASFETLNDAKSWKNKMKAKGIQTDIQPVKIHGATWYRIYTGGWITADEARSQIPEIARLTGIQDLWITRIGAER